MPLEVGGALRLRLEAVGRGQRTEDSWQAAAGSIKTEVGDQTSEDRLRIEKGRKAQGNSLKSLKPLKPFKSQAKLAPTGHCENEMRAER